MKQSRRVLIIYYSYTQQTRLLLRQFAAGLADSGVEVVIERLIPKAPYPFPFASDAGLLRAMLETFLRRRMTVHPVGERCYEEYELIVLAGPTWSYQPSGPVLDFLDRFGAEVVAGRRVLPFISCRSYWRIHLWELSRRLRGCGAKVLEPIVFDHPIPEPYRFLGLLRQLRGKLGRKRDSWFRKRYPAYGHDENQAALAMALGEQLGQRLKGGGQGHWPVR